jgi:serine protease AprX
MARKFSGSLLTLLLVLSFLVPSFAVMPMGVAHANAPTAFVDPALTQALANSVTPVSAIVTFHGDAAPGAAEVALLQQAGITQGLTFRSLPMAGVLATQAQVNALAQRPEVRSIFLNTPVTLYNGDATDLMGVKRLRTNATMTARNGGLPVSGRGVGVVVNDSGVDCTHPDLHCQQNVLGTTNLNAYSGILPVTWVENVPNTDTNSGHGTHVAGSVLGTGAMSAGLYEGTAPGAGLIGYGSGGLLFVLDTIGGFDYAITHQFQYDIRIITNSWGSSGDFNPEHPVNIASKRAHDRGIVVLFAAGNEGPGENTHNPYAKAPWVISVAAGTKQGTLAGFSSRGTKGVGGTFTVDGQSWSWEDRPTITAPGVDIISTRVHSPLPILAAPEDLEYIAPAHLPWYTTMSGTSMATPHAAGVVALMLDANPVLNPGQVKEILQRTATNMPGHESWEVGAGYVNAFAAVDAAFGAPGYGTMLNMTRAFNSHVESSAARSNFTVNYNPITTASNQHAFQVPAGVSELSVRIEAHGIEQETGNTINLVLIAPDGTETSSGVSLLFPLFRDRVVTVSAPAAGQWKVELRGLRGDTLNPIGVALPENVSGVITLKTAGNVIGLNDIAGHPAEAAIKLAVSKRLVDGFNGNVFQPDQRIRRGELAQYLVMSAAIRQNLPLSGTPTFGDVNPTLRPFAEAVVARGAALKDRQHTQNGVMLPRANGSFDPGASVTRVELAYSLVQSLGLQNEALARNNQQLTVQYGNQRIAISDANQIPANMRGYVQLALDLNILNAYFTVTQGPFDLQPTVHASFKPNETITRGAYAVTITRFYNAYLATD